MRLVNVTTKKPIVEFEREEVLFHNKYLEREMRLLGIPIPHGLRGVYDGADYVFLGDRSFQQAFREVYYTTSMDQNDFRWVE